MISEYLVLSLEKLPGLHLQIRTGLKSRMVVRHVRTGESNFAVCEIKTI